MDRGPDAPVTDQLIDIKLELMQLNLYLRDLLAVSGRELPTPQVHVEPPTVVVEARDPSPGGMTPEHLLEALSVALSPRNDDPVIGALNGLTDEVKKALEYTRASMGAAYGPSGGGVVHINPDDVFTMQDRAVDTRYEWQTVSGERKPLYIGTATPGTLTSVGTWSIQKYTYDGLDLGQMQTRTGAWDTRATLF